MFFLCTLAALAAIAAFVFAAPLRAKAWTALAVVAAGALWASYRAMEVLSSGNTIVLWSQQQTPWGVDSGSMDPLSALFLLVISLGSVAAILYSRGYLASAPDRKPSTHISLHYTALAVTSFAMGGVVCSGGGFSFLFFWELMTVASFILILFHADRREVRRAAMTYLILMHVGFVMLVAGFVMLDSACGAASFSVLGQYFATQKAMPLVVVFLLGFGMKAGLFPMHVWLPEAYPAAPPNASALMSGVMINMGIYGILRVVAALPDAATLRTAGIVLLSIGVVSGLWGAILAAMQNEIKRLLAYSSIENVGIIMIGLGIAALGKSSGNNFLALCALTGALLHMVNHSLFKQLLFFGAGNVFSQAHDTSLDALGGLSKRMPVTALLFLAGTAAICALPPMNGFVSEFLIYCGTLSGIASGSDPLASGVALVVLALIGGLVIMTFAKLYGTVFLGAARTNKAAGASEVDSFRIAAMALPLAVMFFIGLFPQQAIGAITRATGFFLRYPTGAADYMLSPALEAVSRTVWLLLAVIGLLAWLRARALRPRTVAAGPTWGCGFTAPDARMQYTGESFSEGLQSMATRLTQNSGEGGAVHKGEIFPAAHNFDVRRKDRFDRLFTAWWVELLRIVNQRVMRLRTGKINHYILYALAFFAVVLIFSILNLI